MYEDIKPENILYLDIETQYLMSDFPGSWKKAENYKNIKIAELGILRNNIYTTFEEENIIEKDLAGELLDAELIVGHNTIQFDYAVLKHYLQDNDMYKIIMKSFDTMLEFDKHTGDAGWVGLDDIAQRNFGMKKTEDSVKVPEMWRNGEKEKVKGYLLNDLKMTERFFLAGLKGQTFKYDHKVYGKSYGEREVYVKW